MFIDIDDIQETYRRASKLEIKTEDEGIEALLKLGRIFLTIWPELHTELASGRKLIFDLTDCRPTDDTSVFGVKGQWETKSKEEISHIRSLLDGFIKEYEERISVQS